MFGDARWVTTRAIVMTASTIGITMMVVPILAAARVLAARNQKPTRVIAMRTDGGGGIAIRATSIRATSSCAISTVPSALCGLDLRQSLPEDGSYRSAGGFPHGSDKEPSSTTLPSVGCRVDFRYSIRTTLLRTGLTRAAR
jgi:hypothetical protein